MKYLATLLACLVAFPSLAWGPTGHRVVGHIAEQYLSENARAALTEIMGHESLARSSTWMDEIKSDTTKRHMNRWHYINFTDEQTVADLDAIEGPHVISTIERLAKALKEGRATMSLQEQRNAVAMLVHLVGDIHQPLHVGRPDDLGGNRIKVEWFGKSSNLHRVWDSEMIDYKQLSYTELANFINHPSTEEVKAWQGSTVQEWAEESRQLAQKVYASAADGDRLYYPYPYAHFATVEQQLVKSGVRLAGLFNDIFE